MKDKDFLCKCIHECLKKHNGSASILEIAKYLDKNHIKDFKDRGNLYYSWQYDFRWAATHLRKKML